MRNATASITRLRMQKTICRSKMAKGFSNGGKGGAVGLRRMSMEDRLNIRHLTSAIIARAVKDCVRAYRYIQKHEKNDAYREEIEDARRVISDCEHFFLSEYFEMINPFPQIYGKDIIERCRTGSFKEMA